MSVSSGGPGNTEFDVVVVGSGAAGLTAALAARRSGARVLVIEKAAVFGGNSALSGGAVWVPNNRVLREAGVADTPEDAARYLASLAGDVPVELRDAFLRSGPEAIDFLLDNTPVRFRWMKGYADYHPENPGGAPRGRSIEPIPIEVGPLGEDMLKLRPRMAGVLPGGMYMTASNLHYVHMMTRTWRGRVMATRIGFRTAMNNLRRRKVKALGEALIAGMVMALRDQGVPLWLSTPLTELVTTGGRVTGVVVERNGVLTTLTARKGVVLASGGFEHNEALREQYQPAPVAAEWSAGAKENTGDGIIAGQDVGASVALMDESWWGPTVVLPGRPPFHLLAERNTPGSLIVNGVGQRFVNECTPYVDFVHRVHEQHAKGPSHVPCYLVFDQRARRRYPFIGIPPGKPFPAEWMKSPSFSKASSLEELARQIGVPEESLVNTVKRFNYLARVGRDEDFGRGDSIYDRYYGDPTIEPNPTLGEIDAAPYYAVALRPGDLGTKGGLQIDASARVIDAANGAPIEGLYAAGNCSASVMGRDYPGAGGTLGPAITFGYLAGKTAASSLSGPLTAKETI